MATSYINDMQEIKSEQPVITMTWKKLYKAKYNAAVPFELALTDSNEVLLCEEIARVIPGKRMVAFGKWNGKAVVAKLFYEPKDAKRHFLREVEGVDALLASGTPTPAILWRGIGENKKIHVILFERIMDSANLEQLWESKKSLAEITPLMQAVTLELATQHVLGVEQKDLHLKNFLISKNKILTIDGGSIVQHPEILSKEESIKHLGLFFSQLGIGSDELVAQLFDTYINARSWLVKDADVELLFKSIREHNIKRWMKYRKKIQRNCTAFVCRNTLNKFMMYDRNYESKDFQALLKHPDKIFDHPETQILKAGNSSTVAKFHFQNQIYVIKRYNMKDTWHWVRRCLRASRAATSWNNSLYLRLFNIPTAKPIAFVEERILGLRGKSYFIMEYVKGPHLGDYFVKHKITSSHDDQTIKIAHQIVNIFTSLYKLNLTHGDLKMTNILVDEHQPILIDLDGVEKHYTSIGLNIAFRKEMKRFMRNWDRQPRISALFDSLIGKLKI